MFTILHVSDVHFGAPDDRDEQSRITEALIKAAQNAAWSPDLCVFSGDLAFRGDDHEFQRGGDWLLKLVAAWKTKLFIVPGNHDVQRSNARHALRQAYQSEAAYAQHREQFSRGMSHLDAFVSWHVNCRATFGDQLLSNWDDRFGCHASIGIEGRNIQLVGLNTALLSCDDHDFQCLVQDIPTLNRLLGKSFDEYDCVITIGHHPLNWLASWNAEEVRRLLGQERGANLYLHGHQHEQLGSALTVATGQSLATLECGAAYQGSRWPQFFSFYRLNFERREIASQVYLYSSNAGEWVIDGSRSRVFVAPIPPFRMIAREQTDSSDEARRAGRPTERAIGDENAYCEVPDTHEADLLELYARRAVEDAESARLQVETFLDGDPFLRSAEYSRTSRIKSRSRIVQKVFQRRKEGHLEFSIKDVTDVCGFRYISLYQSSIAAIIERLLRSVHLNNATASPFRHTAGLEIEIHTSRQPGDPLSIVGAVQEVVANWNKNLKIKVRESRTGYSSVHLIIPCVIGKGEHSDTLVPIEFQIRSVLEEVWGQLDHKLRYGSSRGTVGAERWHLHLNVLKAHFDACIQYIDLIKIQSEERELAPPIEVKNSTLTIESPETELERLRDLPPAVSARVREAYELWKQADASQQFGGDAGLYRRAADAFSAFVAGCPDEVHDPDLSRQFSFTARLERAYLLMFTGDQEELAEARRIYEGLIEDAPSDATAYYRLGQVLARQSRLDDAIMRFDQTIGLISERGDRRLKPDEGWVYDFVRLNLGLAYFRKYEQRNRPLEERRAALKAAIDWTMRTHANLAEKGPGEPHAYRHTINNLLYYAWEERSFVKDQTQWGVSDQLFAELIRLLDSPERAISYEQYDTLARAYLLIGNPPKAIEFAAKVCDWLETAARRRSGGTLDLSSDVPRSFQWMGRILGFLITYDERDALAFALDLLRRSAEPPTEGAASGKSEPGGEPG